MPEKSEEGTRERILNTAIDIIEREGIEAATARAISAEAKVNLAAINYHYRTKDALMAAALAASWNHALEDLQGFLSAQPWDPKVAILEIATFLRLGALRYPTVTRLHFLGVKDRGLLTASLASSRAGSNFWEFVAECAIRVGSSLGIDADWQLQGRTEALFAAMVCPAVAPGVISAQSAGRNEEEYVALLVEDYFKAIQRPVSPTPTN
ncbi:MAG: TetR/AcrR family transcriptional regulator [Spirochaetales bacterium]|jgi:AcrR family transcriptional regulator